MTVTVQDVMRQMRICILFTVVSAVSAEEKKADNAKRISKNISCDMSPESNKMSPL